MDGTSRPFFDIRVQFSRDLFGALSCIRVLCYGYLVHTEPLLLVGEVFVVPNLPLLAYLC